jgi:hypothetical protein
MSKGTPCLIAPFLWSNIFHTGGSMDILDQLRMLSLGNRGNTQAHMMMERVARSKPADAQQAASRARGAMRGVRTFIPPKEEDRVLFFPDKSGMYAHADGFCTFMDKDISGEIDQWREDK